MAIKRGSQSGGKSKGIGSRFFASVVVFFFTLLAFSFLVVGRGLFTAASSGQDDPSVVSSRQDLNWRERLALQHLNSLFSKDVIDVINATTNDLGPLSVDFFRKDKLSASWKVVGHKTTADNATSAETAGEVSKTKQEITRMKEEHTSNEDHSVFLETPAKVARRQLREKRRLIL